MRMQTAGKRILYLIVSKYISYIHFSFILVSDVFTHNLGKQR